MFWRGGLCYFEMVGASLLFIPSHSQNEIIERNANTEAIFESHHFDPKRFSTRYVN